MSERETMRTAIYVRLSNMDSDKSKTEAESESIQNQKAMLIQYSLNKGWSIAEIYIDEDYGGADNERPNFNRLLKDCADGKIDIVLCKMLSRFTRDIETMERIIHNQFQEWGVRFISIVDQMDTDDIANKKTRQINGLVNQWYLEELSASIRSSLRIKRQQGQFTGAFAPYGYTFDPNNNDILIIDPCVKDVVKLIFELYNNNLGYGKIAQILNDKMIPSPYQYKKLCGSKLYSPKAGKNLHLWSSQTVRNILKNEVYIGNMIQGKTENISYKSKKRKYIPQSQWIRVKKTHQPIIDRSLWDVVEKRIGRNIKTAYKTGEIQKYNKMAYCGSCGAYFVKNTSKQKGKTFEYLVCSSQKVHNKACPNHHAIRIDQLDQAILGEINKLVLNYADHTLLLKGIQIYVKKNRNNKLAPEDILKQYGQIDKLDRKILEELIERIEIDSFDRNLNIRKIKIKWRF